MLCHVPPAQMQSPDPDEQQRHSAVPVEANGLPQEPGVPLLSA